jgi:hypothetical protein
MTEYASSEVRVHKALPGSVIGVVGQAYFVDFFDVLTQKETRLGIFCEDGRFSPPNLNATVKEKLSLPKTVVTPVNESLLKTAKIPVESFA